MSYGHVYVAQIAFGAKMQQTVQALLEAEAHTGPSLIIAYSHCIAHGYDMVLGADQQKGAVNSGLWGLYRYDPRRVARGEPPLVVDVPGGKIPVHEYMRNETRFRMVEKVDPQRFHQFAIDAQIVAERRMALYQHLSKLKVPDAVREEQGRKENRGDPVVAK
jgi:pyruvate-ferredoxin/flavodoxin oxidoreductase